MSIADYISVFVSIIIGLAVTDLAMSIHRLMRAGDRVTWDWLTPLVALLMLLNILAYWWFAYHWYQGVARLSIGGFLPDLAIFLVLILTVAAALPDEVPAEGLKLRDYYLSSARYLWSMFAINVVLVILLAGPRYVPSQAGPASWLLAQWPNLLSVALALLLVFTRRIWIHGAVILILLGFAILAHLPATIGN